MQTTSTINQRTTPAQGPVPTAPRGVDGGAVKAQRRARGIDEDALVREHLPLIQYAVAELASRIPGHVHRSDLVSAGMLGLTQAARSFDPERGIAFDRFASTRIRGALLDELRGRDWASRSVRARARRMQQVTQDLTTRLGRTPTGAEVAGAMGLDVDATDLLRDLFVDEQGRPRTVVLTTHNVERALGLVDRVVVVAHGTIILDALAREVNATEVSASIRQPRAAP